MDYKGAAFKGNIYGALHLLHLTELSLEEKSAKPAFPLNSTASIFYVSTIRKVFCFMIKSGMNAPAKLMTVVFFSHLFCRKSAEKNSIPYFYNSSPIRKVFSFKIKSGMKAQAKMSK